MKKGLSASTLKIIAIVTMVIDHISWGFFDFYSWQGYMLHIIGRLTIPIMCFFIAEGFRKTHDLKRYILRMAGFAAITTVPFYLFFHEEYAYRQNIIFDYLLALLLLTVLESKRFKKPAKVLLSALLVTTSMVIGGWPVMPMVYVLIFYYADSFKKQAVWFCGATVGLVLFMMIGITLNKMYNFYPMYNYWVWWDKAYFLGLMITDGNVCGNFVSLSLKSTDRDIIKTFAQKTRNSNKLSEDKRGNGMIRTGAKCKDWVKDLVKHNVYANKTYTTAFPDTVDEKFMSHFIRGLIDGDGWISYKSHSIGFCGTERLVTQVRDKLVDVLGVFNVKVIHSGQHLWMINWASKRDIKNIGEFLYKDKRDCYLKRKYNNYLKIINANTEVSTEIAK